MQVGLNSFCQSRLPPRIEAVQSILLLLHPSAWVAPFHPGVTRAAQSIRPPRPGHLYAEAILCVFVVSPVLNGSEALAGESEVGLSGVADTFEWDVQTTWC